MVEDVDVADLRARAAMGERTLLHPAEFLDQRVVKHKPVIFRGLARNWTFRGQAGSDEWLVERLGDVSTRVETKDDDKHKVPPNMPFADFLAEHRLGENVYMVDETPPALHPFIPLPEPVRCARMSAKFFVTYFWMSTGQTDSKMHIDTDENMMCVLHGTKRVFLVDPAYSEDVYADASYSIGVSPIDTHRVNHTLHPRAAGVPYDLAEVRAGDCFFLPQNYWHYVHSFGRRNQAVTMWWKSKPIVKPDLFNSTLRSLSFAQTLANYETYVQAVAPITPATGDECDSEAQAAGEAMGLGAGAAARRAYLDGPESVHMSDFEFATDKEDGASFGEDTKGDRDEEDWVNPEQERLGLPDAFSHCHFNLSNPRNPCFVAGCASRDDTFGCLRYTLEYCRRFADYGCQDLVWTLNKKSGAEYRVVTAELPDLFEVDVEAWPAKARADDEDGQEMEAEEEDDVEEGGPPPGMRAGGPAPPSRRGEFLDDEDDEADEDEAWGEVDDEAEPDDVLPGVVRDASRERGAPGSPAGASAPGLVVADADMPRGLTRQERRDHRALLRWMHGRGLLSAGPPSSLARSLDAALSRPLGRAEL